MIEFFGTIATILAIAGVIYNNRMSRVCFWFWLASNAITAVIHCQASLWSLAVRDIVFFVLAFDGLKRWSKSSFIENKDIKYLKNRLRAADIIIEKLGCSIDHLKSKQQKAEMFIREIADVIVRETLILMKGRNNGTDAENREEKKKRCNNVGQAAN
jgi:nicotinamide riboside transporter PnuC